MLRDSAGCAPFDRDAYLTALGRRLALARAWSVFMQQHPVLLMPVSWQRQFPIDEDQHDVARMDAVIAAQSPLLATALLGLPGLSVPTGVSAGLPQGVQLVTARFGEDLLLRVGEQIERAAGFNALDHLAPLPPPGRLRPT